ncbi:hypothetical protein VPHK165_0016 [Vibrio phage K165]|nr:hypothetical protein MYOV022v2_p0013 [Vibrio phage 12E28.1]QZI90182.1 hypothetical protein MYOV021v2_p0013 [Vibrio phage 18E29.1]QZI90703.1 hypothetical protein MYOV020v1_p0077 [Vibrio phage 98E28.6a]
MKSFKERIEVNNNQDKCKDRATHKHSNGDLYVKSDEPHEFGKWLNFDHSNGFWTKSLLETGNESVLTTIKKPAPTKFVKVEESIFDLKEEFERGELFTKLGDTYIPLSDCEKAFASSLLASSIYRQVEIDWRDEVKEVYDAVELPVGEQGSLYMGEDWDEQGFIEFCHLVASLTEKPEGV